jgi:hypothetical protein
MKQIGLIRAINRASEKYYGTISDQINNHEKYLEDCNKYFFEYLKDTLSDGFIFSALSYINYSTEKIELVKGEDEHTKYNFNTDNERLKKELEISLRAVLNDEIIGMTAILLSKKNKNDFFLIDSEDSFSRYESIKETEGNIFLMPLVDMTYTELYEDFKKVNQPLITKFISDLKSEAKYEVMEEDKIGKYLWHYKRMSNCYVDPFHVHFIRPSFIDFDHNLLLSLATNRCLTQEELAFINLFIYRMVGQMAIELKAEREKINLISSHKHTMRNFGINEHLANLKSAIDYNNKEKALEILGKVDNLSLFKDITIDMMYRIGQQANGELLIFKKGITTYSKILLLIHNGTINEHCKLNIQRDICKTADTVPINDMIDVFNLLNNLYSNGLRESISRFIVSIKKIGDELVVSFENDKLLDTKFINAENKLQMPVSYPKDKGLRIINDICQKKDFINLDIFSKEQTTIFQLTIKQIKI